MIAAGSRQHLQRVVVEQPPEWPVVDVHGQHGGHPREQGLVAAEQQREPLREIVALRAQLPCEALGEPLARNSHV